MTLFEIIIFCIVLIPVIALVDWNLFVNNNIMTCPKCKKEIRHKKWDWLVATFLEVLFLMVGIMFGALFK